MRNWFLAICAVSVLGGCTGEAIWASDEEVAKAAYRHDGPPRLTLFTMINNNSGAGAHTSLMINGSQRVIWDPAGSFKHHTLPERNDVVFGITPGVAKVYTRYHARETYHVKVQKLDVPPELAQRAMQVALSKGPAPSAQCSLSTSQILAQLFPGQVKPTWFPVRLAEDFGKLPGVTEKEFYEYDSDDNSKVLKEWNPNAVAQAAVDS